MASVEVRGKSKKIYLRFRYLKKEYRVPTQYDCEKKGQKNCKCRGCNSATGLGYEIERKIKEGIFDSTLYFPDTKAFAEQNQDQRLDTFNLTFHNYALMHLEYSKNVLAGATYKLYKTAVNMTIPYLPDGILLKDITAIELKEVVNGLIANDNTPKTIYNYMGALSAIFSQAINDGLIEVNPCSKIKLPKKIKPKIDPFTQEEIELILAKCNELYPSSTLFYAIGFYTGIRPGENLALQWTDFDFINHRISITKTRTQSMLKPPKTGKEHFVDIIPTLDKYIKNHKQYTFLKNSWIYLFKDNEILQTSVFADRLKVICQHAGVRYRVPYQMRHSFATMMLAAGEDPNWVKNMLGHADLTMLFRVYGNWYIPPKGRRAGNRFEMSANNVCVQNTDKSNLA